MSPDKPENMIQCNLRLRPDDLAAVREYAKMHDRSLNGELRLAVAVHLRNHSLAFVTHPEGEAAVREDGEDPAKVRRRITEDLKVLCEDAYSIPEPARPPVVTDKAKVG